MVGGDVAGDVLAARELELAAQVAELRERLATAQAEVAALGQIIADLREQVQWLRLPWWRRMFGS